MKYPIIESFNNVSVEIFQMKIDYYNQIVFQD